MDAPDGGPDLESTSQLGKIREEYPHASQHSPTSVLNMLHDLGMKMNYLTELWAEVQV